MKRAELERVYPNVRPLLESEKFACDTTDLILDTMQIGGFHFRAEFHFDNTIDSFAGVGLDCLDKPLVPSMLDTLGSLLQVKYGSPAKKKESILSNEWVWELPSTTIGLIYMDMSKANRPGVTSQMRPGMSILCVPRNSEALGGF